MAYSTSTIEARGGKLTLQQVAGRINEISTLPQVTFHVMEVANDPGSGAADLKDVMEGDAALSARVLRYVNSSAYATRTKITNLQQAIAYLGLKQIRNMAMTASVSELFLKDERIGPYRRPELWRHLVSVGICARLIALRRKLRDFEDAFLAGLLHDIGIVLEDQHAHAAFCDVIDSLDEQQTLAAVESKTLGFDHAQLGERVAKAWNFPESIVASIRYHHMSASYRGDAIDIVRCVEVANLLCTLMGASSVGMKLVRISQPALTGLSLTRDDIAVLSTDLKEELARNASLFAM